MAEERYNVNVDKPTKTVTIHGPGSPYGPDPKAEYKQSRSDGKFKRDGGWFTGLTKEIVKRIIEYYKNKGYTIKKYP